MIQTTNARFLAHCMVSFICDELLSEMDLGKSFASIIKCKAMPRNVLL